MSAPRNAPPRPKRRLAPFPAGKNRGRPRKGRVPRALNDPFALHEALHMAWVIGRLLDAELIRHPAVLLRPALRRRAERIGEDLAALYQQLGALSAEGD